MSSLAPLIDALRPVPLLVVGDLTLDEFLTGEVVRISREAPVPILEMKETKRVPGGAANAAANAQSLGAQVLAAGVVGQDEQGEALVAILQALGMQTPGVMVDPSRPTTTKSRVLASSRQSIVQQVARLDRLSREPLAVAQEDQLVGYLEATIPSVSAVLLSDYENGALTPRVIATCLNVARSCHKPVVVDSQSDLSLFQGATVVKPNLPEAERQVRYPIRTEADLIRAGQDLLDLSGADNVLITRGGDGMSLFERSGTVSHVPAFNRSEVFDVTGAGDTVAATLTVALASGLSNLEAVVLANLAASVVVRRFGTCTTHPAELHDALSNLNYALPQTQRSLR